MLEREKFHARFDFLRAEVMEARSRWKQVFIKEMRDLLQEEQPQEMIRERLHSHNDRSRVLTDDK